MTQWITSDLHFGHANILKYQADTRPYNSIEHMNEDYISEWNRQVRPNDEVFILGDFAFMNPEQAAKTANRLNGHKNLIIGNHDYKLIQDDKFCRAFVSVDMYREVNYSGAEGKFLLVMFHFPILEWNRCHRGSIHLYGHLHGKTSGLESNRAADVGVDAQLQVVSKLDDVIRKVKDNPTIAHGDGY